MPTRDPAKNRVYVKKSKDRKKLEIGVEEFNKIHAGEQQKHLQKLKEEKGEEKFKEDRATYMKEFMCKKRAKEREEQKQKQIQEVQRKVSAVSQARTMTDDLFSSFLSAIPEKRQRGRPKGAKNKPKVVQPTTMSLRPRPRKM